MKKGQVRNRACPIILVNGGDGLLGIASPLLTVAFARQRFFGALLFTGFQVERMPLDFLDDVFGLHLALETAERALQGFSILDMYFSQS